MAKRPIFVSNETTRGLVQTIDVEFNWYAGFSLAQMQKSVNSLHENARKKGIAPVLEISSKSPSQLGVQLSAFNLRFNYMGHSLTVETAYQGSKVFQSGGPFVDIYSLSSRDAKRDERLQNHGALSHFNFFGLIWELQPTTAFYDWLYIQALLQNPRLCDALKDYKAFSDIVFNPQKSFSCQARTAALYLSLEKMGLVQQVTNNPGEFEKVYEMSEEKKMKPEKYHQASLL